MTVERGPVRPQLNVSSPTILRHVEGNPHHSTLTGQGYPHAIYGCHCSLGWFSWSLQYTQWAAATVITVSPISGMQRQTGSETRQ
jgi:hypothetical protein